MRCEGGRHRRRRRRRGAALVRRPCARPCARPGARACRRRLQRRHLPAHVRRLRIQVPGGGGGEGHWGVRLLGQGGRVLHCRDPRGQQQLLVRAGRPERLLRSGAGLCLCRHHRGCPGVHHLHAPDVRRAGGGHVDQVQGRRRGADRPEYGPGVLPGGRPRGRRQLLVHAAGRREQQRQAAVRIRGHQVQGHRRGDEHGVPVGHQHPGVRGHPAGAGRGAAHQVREGSGHPGARHRVPGQVHHPGMGEDVAGPDPRQDRHFHARGRQLHRREVRGGRHQGGV
mmetsp:Transcript_5658/g.14342  ORF Transcript_5658/g.14342 Transcript_5658/m.14342 type:complete len:282 (+) Transcript_5658:1777-2622(+)